MTVQTTNYNVRIPSDDRWDLCEHVQPGDTAAYVFCEDDSFGPVGRYACCKECGEKAEKVETEDCHDCGGEFVKKEMYRFWGYDWTISQGDEPLYICKCCQAKEKHIERVVDNKRNYEMEMSYLDDDMFDDDEGPDAWDEEFDDLDGEYTEDYDYERRVDISPTEELQLEPTTKRVWVRK